MADPGQSGNDPGPEVGLGKIAIDLPEARLNVRCWISAGSRNRAAGSASRPLERLTVSISPNGEALLASNTTYTITITGVKDTAGNQRVGTVTLDHPRLPNRKVPSLR